MGKPAILGGQPLLSETLPKDNSIDHREKEAVLEVLDSGVLSDFYGSPSPRFLGGPKVRELEQRWQEYFDVPYAVSVNSATSGLHAAVLAAGVGPGDEVVVPPYTMSATASSVLMANAVPVFADINDRNFCLDLDSVRLVAGPLTKAIIAVNLFGGPADLGPLMDFCQERNIVLIEDNAQGPGGLYRNRFLGTIGHLGVFSLNCHKVIQCGEGGVVVTRSEKLAIRLQLVRNHGENVVESMGWSELENMLGYNYRLTELQAAVAMIQLEKLEELTRPRIEMADCITECLQDRPELVLPEIHPGDRHVYYLYPFRFLPDRAGFSRDLFLKALRAEGLPAANYVAPLYLAPMYREQVCHGKGGCPMKCPWYKGRVSYGPGLCPVVERMWREEFVCTDICRWPLGRREADLFADGVLKVLEAAEELRCMEEEAPVGTDMARWQLNEAR